MSGISKRKYDGEKMKYNKSIKRPLHLISEILPKDYDGTILLEYFKKYYPAEWDTLVQMQNQYAQKDDFLKSKCIKTRYKPLSAEKYFFALSIVKNILSNGKKEKYKNTFNEVMVNDMKLVFEEKRKNAIKNRTNRIEKNNLLVQNIDPRYIDFYITEYHCKGIDTEQKVEIISDLSKYNSDKINTFFYKLNDAERNIQVRQMAFKYLQDRGLYVKLRKNFKGKKKAYEIEKCKFDVTPEDLFDRLKGERIQAKKQYDVFISHSYSNQKEVITLFKQLNSRGFSCYCDWTSDNDFLKRSMAGEYTKEVLRYRLDQSDIVIYVSSEAAKQSKWVAFELEYANSIDKKIIEITIEDIDNDMIEDIIKEKLYNGTNI